MINASAEALVEMISEDDLARRATFPENKDIRAIAAHLAMRVMIQAIDEGVKVGLSDSHLISLFCIDYLLQLGNRQAYEALQEKGEEGLKEYIYSKMWNPEYRPLVYLPPGKGE